MTVLEKLRASLREKSGLLAGLQLKAFADEATDDDVSAYDGAIGECEAIEKKIGIEERAEAVRAKGSVVATAPAGSGEQQTALHAQAAPPAALTADKALGIAAAAAIVSRRDGQSVKDVLDEAGHSGFLGHLDKMAKLGNPQARKALNTLVSSQGGILVPAAVLQGGIMPLLRAQSTFVDAGPRRVALIDGKFTQARGLTGATASYVGEGAAKPVSTPTFDAVSMSAKKLAGIVALTNEMQRWAFVDIEAWVREELRSVLALTMDLNAWLGTGSGASPVGILNKSGVTTVVPTFASATNPTLAELDAMATRFILALTAVNIYANGNWRWVMPYRTAMRLADIRDANGNSAFPDMNLGRVGGPLWKGFPVIVTSQIPVNGGAGTDETTVALVDFSYVLFGEEEGIVLRASDQATLNTTGATDGTGLVHLFQQNQMALLAESMHDFGLRTALAVAKAVAIRF